ncbi:hypothetical protein LAZ67_16002694 [Cordylochernes scorpioides]|uniref:TIL domain-containing protein n=1 Tax=Cordylochernes scorpioides TaxID=51811 RepID=A0ABY6LC75_9ARAC|nr:hypothetical protein LAZ67_16002694 [Cordylochernes scorpioides]
MPKDEYIHFETYRQIRGSPMGSSFSTIAAELVMIKINNLINDKHKTDIGFWRRYVDDILCICDGNSVDAILTSLNNYHIRQCTKPNEEFSPCGPACQINCTTYNNPPFCIQMCVPGCFCNPDYIRETDDSSDCIRPEECE